MNILKPHQVIGKLTLISTRRIGGIRRWLCQCECGATIEKQDSKLKERRASPHACKDCTRPNRKKQGRGCKSYDENGMLPQDPRPEEIAARAAEIRAEWDARTEQYRRGYRSAPVEVQRVYVCAHGHGGEFQ